MKRTTIIGLLLFTSAALVACGGDDSTDAGQAGLCSEEARADEFVVGMEKSTVDSKFGVRLTEVLVQDTPKPPDRGDNLWTFQVVDASGAPVDGAMVDVKPWMPDHGHGTNPLHLDARLEPQVGTYEVGPFDLFMGGFWEFTFTVDAAGTTDTVDFGFCVEG